MTQIMYEISSYLEQQNIEGDDSLFLIDVNGVIWFCVSDGAGGTAGGKIASLSIVAEFEKCSKSQGCRNPENFEDLLRKLDSELARDPDSGEATAIVGKIEGRNVFGASVGDSEAWIFNREYEYQLTGLQNRKPLVGSGVAHPIGFGPMELELALLVGSDGLFNYTEMGSIKSTIKGDCAAADIAGLAKQATGKLQDDLSSILIRRKS